MDLTPSLNAKNFFRFTGPPEHWLTAVKYMTWGLEEKHKSRWEKIQPGDVFFIHSTGLQTSRFNNAKSGIIGLGVIGSNFAVKDSLLWLYELENSINRWPLLVPLSEIYLFSELPTVNTWESPTQNNYAKTKNLINSLLKNYVPLSKIKRFPQMGSFSSVSKEVAEQILYEKRPLYEYSDDFTEENIRTAKPTQLTKVKNVSETFRYAGSLKIFNSIKKRVVKESKGYYEKDNELLAKAERIHGSILQNLIDIFRSKGYETLYNKYIDLFAHNKEQSFLFEVKSTENRNFRSQARKGIIQLFEYDYFEVNKFVNEKDLNFKNKFKILVPSQIPQDNRYVKFINSLELGVATVKDNGIDSIGEDLGFTNL